MQGTPLQTNVSVLAKYKKRLKKLVRAMTKETSKRLTSFFKKGYVDDYFESQETSDENQNVAVMDDKSPSSQSRIMLNKLRRKYEKLLKEMGEVYAKSMLDEVNRDSESRVSVSFNQLSDGVSQNVKIKSPAISEELKAHLAWNVSLIKDISSQYFNQIQGLVTRSISQGGAFDISKELIKYDGITKKRAGRIAEDQTRKAFNNLNEQRFKEAGLNKFRWNHSSAGQTPRPLHLELDGNVYSFDDLPIVDEITGRRGIPGQEPLCRCYMTPVIELD